MRRKKFIDVGGTVAERRTRILDFERFDKLPCEDNPYRQLAEDKTIVRRAKKAEIRKAA